MILYSAVYFSMFANQAYIGHFKCHATTTNAMLAHGIIIATLALFLQQCQGKYMTEHLRNVSIYQENIVSWICHIPNGDFITCKDAIYNRTGLCIPYQIKSKLVDSNIVVARRFVRICESSGYSHPGNAMESVPALGISLFHLRNCYGYIRGVWHRVVLYKC